MFSWIKFLPAVLKFKDVSEAYLEEKAAGRPFYLSRRFVGVALVALAAVFGGIYGELDANFLSTLTDNVYNLITAIAGMWGGIVTLVGIFQAKKA